MELTRVKEATAFFVEVAQGQGVLSIRGKRSGPCLWWILAGACGGHWREARWSLLAVDLSQGVWCPQVERRQVPDLKGYLRGVMGFSTDHFFPDP